MDTSRLLNVFERLQGCELIGYGAGYAAQATMRTCRLPLSFIVDDSPALQGSTMLGVPIRSPSCLADVDKDSCMVIAFANTAKAFHAIAKRLLSWKLEYDRHWIDCSFLHYHSMAGRLQSELAISTDPDLFVRNRLLHLYSSIENLSSIAGTWLVEELLRKLSGSVLGGIAEMGVYKGGNAFNVLFQLDNVLQDRTYHLFDSFAGFPGCSADDPSSRMGEFADVSFESVTTLFSHFPNVRVHRGIFTDTLPDVGSESFCFVYVDCDLYEPTIECCEFFYERMSPGGIMLFHDYDWGVGLELPAALPAPFTGIQKAVDGFFANRPEEILVFPETTHALVVKK